MECVLLPVPAVKWNGDTFMVRDHRVVFFFPLLCLFWLYICFGLFQFVSYIIIKDQNSFYLSKRLPPAMLISKKPPNVFFPPFFPLPCHHLKCSLFMSDGRQLQGSTFPWRLAFVTMVAGQYWQPLCHPCTPVTQGWGGHSEHTDTLYWSEHKSMD